MRIKMQKKKTSNQNVLKCLTLYYYYFFILRGRKYNLKTAVKATSVNEFNCRFGLLLI